MKNKLYKIRNTPTSTARNTHYEEGLKWYPFVNSNQIPHDAFPTVAGAQNDHESHFQKLVSMFQTFIKTSENKQPQAHIPYQLEARDRDVLIPIPNIIDGTISPGALKTWVTSVVKTVCSSAFNSFFKKEMNYQQTKIYCSENIFKNIVVLSSKYAISPTQMELIDNHIKNGVLTYLSAKYPLTDSTEINKRLQAAIRQVDNSGALDNNYFTHSKIAFEFRGSGNYNDLIMLMLNDLMGIVNSENQEETSNYQQFQEIISSVFEKVEDEEWMLKSDRNDSSIWGKMSVKQAEVASSKINQRSNIKGEGIPEDKQKFRRLVDQKEKYKAKIKEYTHYQIGRKISENTPTYSTTQIQSGNLTIKSPTILRILTKWCDQLDQKYHNNYFTNRSESVKVQRGGNVNVFRPWLRVIVDAKMDAELLLINQDMKTLFKNNYDMQTSILNHEMSLNGDEFIDHFEKISGKLSVKVVKNLHTYIITYLNRLIHGILKASKQLFEEANLFDYNVWPSPPNLLTFRIKDLMRCKCSSQQREILKIYRQLQRISRESPEKMKIIRVKNRLRSGTNDILINVRFKDQIICEIQLAIKSKASDFIKCSNSFHHYLYELQRSIFGPITQLCSIWNSLDQRTNIYKELVEEEQSMASPQQHQGHVCARLKEKFKMKPFEKPFVCSLCHRTYHHSNYILQHIKCDLCGYIVCGYCQIQGDSEDQLKNRFISSPQLRQICKRKLQNNQKLPSFGVCIYIQSKDVKEEVFTLIAYQKKNYLLGKRDGEIFDIYNISSKKMIKKFRKKFVIFEAENNEQFTKIGQKQAINHHIILQTMRANFKKQKQSVNLMELGLKTEQCKKILSLGSKSQKETVKNFFFVENAIEQLPFDPYQFPNVEWIAISINPMKSFEGVQHLQHLKKARCINNKLTMIPPQFYECPSIQDIMMADNLVTRIDDGISKLKRITGLALTKNRLTELPQSLFECRTLIDLKMNDNQLACVPDSIRRLNRLEIIDFSQNRLEKVTDSIGQLTNLREIYLQKNPLVSVLPQSVRNLHMIEKIDISATQISSIPMPYEGWPNIRMINLSKSQVSVPPQILFLGEKLEHLFLNDLQNFIFPEEGNFNNLKVLERMRCNAEGFPKCMERMTNLITLNYEQNNLANINSIPVLPNLESLDLRDCKLSTIPRMTGLKRLKKINLSYNDGLVLPTEGMSLPAIQEFTCTNSKLTKLSPCMLKWNRLTKLDVKCNEITTFFDEETETTVASHSLEWPNLKSLFLNNNQLQAFPEVILNSLHIEKVQLSQNKIRSIPASIKNLTKLSHLIMNQNHLNSLPPEFGQLSNLTNALFFGNNISVIPMFIKDMPKLNMIQLETTKIEVVECEEWILRTEMAQFAELKLVAQKLKDEREKHRALYPNRLIMRSPQRSDASPGYTNP